MSRVLVLIVFVWFCTNGLVAANIIPTVILGSESQERMVLADSTKFFLDISGKLDIEDLLQVRDENFTTIPDLKPESSFYGWIKFNVRNDEAITRHEYLNLCSATDTFWVYKIKDGAVLESGISGAAFPPSKSELRSNYTYFPISLLPGDSISFFVRTFVRNPENSYHLMHLSIQPSWLAIQKTTHHQNLAWFYTGVMALFALVSFFLFFLFKENEFIFYGLFMLSFAFYLSVFMGVFQVWFDYASPGLGVSYLQLAISFIVFSGSAFIYSFLNLKNTLPAYSPYFVGIAVFTFFFTHVTSLFTANVYTLSYINNINLLVWVIGTVYPVVLLYKKGDKAAKSLILSFSILAVTTFIYLFNLLSTAGGAYFTIYIFLGGTILFSGTLFYGLFDKINTIRTEKSKMEELDKLKSMFFANISHEFRTPLTLVKGPIDQVLPNITTEKDRILLTTARQNADRLLALINQLLDLSKLESGKVSMEVANFNFTRLLKGIIMSFESLATEKKIELRFIAPETDIFLFVDERKVVRIFYNLLSNAIKFTPIGKEIRVGLTETSEVVTVEVTDTGRGIAEEKIPYIFDRFF
ncbi:MAG: hypothetical protein KDC24_09520, partial [Saprospiraceae bacterium]|nr:hypothetical protein [Saprospiraceae bacterium]